MLIKKNKLLLIVFVLITCANAFIFINRDDFAYIKQSSFAELYPLTGELVIKDTRKLNDSTITLVPENPLPKPINWQVYVDDILLKQLNTKESFFVVQEGVHRYMITAAGFTDTIRLTAEYISAKSSAEKDRIGHSGITIFRTAMPTVTLLAHMNKWKDDEIAVSEAELNMIHSILKDSVKLNGSESTIEQIKRLGAYLGSRLAGASGNPTSAINGLSVFQQYKRSFSGQQLWCGNYAQIFNLFAKQAGIKSRVVHISGRFGSIGANVHIFNEYYIPELKQWAAIDLLFNNIMYKDASGKMLNAVEVKNTNPADSSVSVLQATLEDSLMARPFSSMGTDFFDVYGRYKDLRFYHSIYYDRIYSAKEKIARYVTKQSWYEVYSDVSIADNQSFYIKLLFLLLEILSMFLVITILIQWRHKRQ